MAKLTFGELKNMITEKIYQIDPKETLPLIDPGNGFFNAGTKPENLMLEEGDNGYVQVVKIWSGSGYVCDRILVKTDTTDAEEALERAVAFIEKDDPESKLLLDVSETEEEAENDGLFDPKTGHADPAFKETYCYVDATEFGASSPWYVYEENLDVALVSDEDLDKLTDETRKRLDENGATYITDDDFKENINEEDTEERNPSLMMCDRCGHMFSEFDMEIIDHRILCPSCAAKQKTSKETKTMKINENTKVTLTIGQLKKLVREANDGTGIVGTVATNKTVGAMKQAGITPAQASQWANGNAQTRNSMVRDIGAKLGHPEVRDQAGLYNAVVAQSGGRLSPTGASNVVHRAAVKLAKESDEVTQCAKCGCDVDAGLDDVGYDKLGNVYCDACFCDLPECIKDYGED